jgi:hypothetical protein
MGNLALPCPASGLRALRLSPRHRTNCAPSSITAGSS